MSFTKWILSSHPFFAWAQESILSLIGARNISNFDDLVVQSRLPARTALLVLSELVSLGKIKTPSVSRTGSFEKGVPSNQKINIIDNIFKKYSLDNSFLNKYLQITAVREKPVLIWGQRRLIPSSSIERYLYVINSIKAENGSIAFLGDDDLVSPLVAAWLPNWRVEVFDIDKVVLHEAQSVARQLGGNIIIRHIDVSQTNSEWTNQFDIVVCDPFPSGDGSFENMFWRQAAKILRPEGKLITTIAPSHKPTFYGVGALNMLNLLGFSLLDIQADAGKYEIFDFEFTDFEQSVLSKLDLVSNISHTKSLITVELVHPTAYTIDETRFNFDFNKWNQSVASHYLTQQAGISDQLNIANKRGLYVIDNINFNEQRNGLRVESVFPNNLRMDPDANKFLCTKYWAEIITTLFKVIPAQDEMEELVRLAQSSEIKTTGRLAQLGLAIRAIESWQRWRFDDAARARSL